MTFLQILLQSVVEGVTEFLPVSSTGHLILTARLLGLPATAFQKTFEIFIQLGAIAAVAALYWRRLLVGGNWRLVAAAFIPTAFVGVLVHKVVKQVLFGNIAVVIISLFVGGVVFLLVEAWYDKRSVAASSLHNWTSLTLRQAFTLGFWQAAALVPGVSRSGAVIVGGLLAGLSRPAAVEFSFLLAIPTMTAATLFDLATSWSSLDSADSIALSLGFLGAAASAWIVVKWFIAYIQSHSLRPFAWYRIVLALAWAAAWSIF